MTTPEIIFLSAASPFIITLVILSVCMIARWINIRDLILYGVQYLLKFNAGYSAELPLL